MSTASTRRQAEVLAEDKFCRIEGLGDEQVDRALFDFFVEQAGSQKDSHHQTEQVNHPQTQIEDELELCPGAEIRQQPRSQ